MKCSNPDCNHGFGLVSHRRGWFSKRRYCSKHCRDAVMANIPKLQQKRSTTTYFEWLFEQPVLKFDGACIMAPSVGRTGRSSRFLHLSKAMIAAHAKASSARRQVQHP